jgi:hypothetical protein
MNRRDSKSIGTGILLHTLSPIAALLLNSVNQRHMVLILIQSEAKDLLNNRLYSLVSAQLALTTNISRHGFRSSVDDMNLYLQVSSMNKSLR